MTIQAECRREAHQTAKIENLTELVEDYFFNRRTTGATAQQCEKDLRFIHGDSIRQNSIHPRVSELHKGAHPTLVATGEKRKTDSGSPATVYIHSYFAEQAADLQRPLFTTLEGGKR